MAIEWKQEAQGREKIYFFVLLLLVVFMFARVLWGPRMARTAVQKKEFATVMLQVKTYKDRLGELTKRRIAGAPPAQATPSESHPTDARFAPYLRGEIKSPQEVMGDVVRRLTAGPQTLKGLSLVNMAFGTETAAGTYLTIPLELTFEGPFPALVGYLEAVEQQPLLLTIDNVELSTLPDKGGILHAKLLTTVYVVRSAAAITAGGGAGPAPGTPSAPAK